MVAIENLQPGDMVYAMEAVGEEQSVDVDSDIETKAILQTYVHETDETYLVSIDGEDIETTAEHPFYNADGEEVAAKDLQEGDTVTTADGDTATVDAVTCIHHDEPVKVYNIAVCDDHTYFVGETHVLVHNACQPSSTHVSDAIDNTISNASKQQNPNQKALHDLAKEASKNAKNGNPISYDEARILDDWAMEYNVPQHHQAYWGSGAHFPGGGYADHTHIFNIHVPFK